MQLNISHALNTAKASLQEASQHLEPKPKTKEEKAMAFAKEYEGQFISLMLKEMFTGLGEEEGAGASEENWRELMIDEYGKQISNLGGLGLAPQIASELLRMQENNADTTPPPSLSKPGAPYATKL